MRISRSCGEAGAFAGLDGIEMRVLGAKEERELLHSLADCRRQLVNALGRAPGAGVPSGSDDREARSHPLAARGAGTNPAVVQLGTVRRHYDQLRSKLALANVRLIAHLAKPYRHHGIPDADLLQEGFCGLLEAIDRFDLNYGTKLGTYATWWIRQALQRAVAAGAYAVRLTPRHLRRLAQNQGVVKRGRAAVAAPGDPDPGAAAGQSELIRRVYTATRPALPLEAAFDGGSGLGRLPAVKRPGRRPHRRGRPEGDGRRAAPGAGATRAGGPGPEVWARRRAGAVA
jgi:RNA polymerase primary sigma factor